MFVYLVAAALATEPAVAPAAEPVAAPAAPVEAPAPEAAAAPVAAEAPVVAEEKKEEAPAAEVKEESSLLPVYAALGALFLAVGGWFVKKSKDAKKAE